MFHLILASLFVLQAFAVTTNFTLTISTDALTSNATWVFTSGASGTNPTIQANIGDIIIFTVNATTDDPFSVHTTNSAGTTGDRYVGLNPQVLTTNGIANLTIGSDAPSTLFYVSETNASAVGMIQVMMNCTGAPSLDNGSAGTCSSVTTLNGLSCTPVCNSGFTPNGTLSAMCVNGTWTITGNCTNNTSPPTPTPTPTPTPSGNSVTYIFVITGTSSNNCNYMQNTVVPNLNTWGDNNVQTNGASFTAQLTNCNNNYNNNNDSSWTITVTVAGSNADTAVIDEETFSNQLQNQLQLDSSVTVDNIDSQRNSGIFIQASLLTLLAIVLISFMA